MQYAGGAVLAAFALAVGIIIGKGSEPASAPSATPSPATPKEIVVVPPDDPCVQLRARGRELTPHECATARQRKAQLEREYEMLREFHRNRTNYRPPPRRVDTPGVCGPEGSPTAC